MSFTVQFMQQGRQMTVAVHNAKTPFEAEHTVRGRYRLGPHLPLYSVPGTTPGAQVIGVTGGHGKTIVLWTIGALLMSAVLAGILGAMLKR